LTPPDPQLKGAWYPGGFNPRTYQVRNRFQNLGFQNATCYRYSAVLEAVSVNGLAAIAGFNTRVWGELEDAMTPSMRPMVGGLPYSCRIQLTHSA
jgi:hypothetical protein